MKKFILSGLLVVACCVVAMGQSAKTDTLKYREFIGTALYGYMNGGSDLYYEYGFKKLAVADLNYTFRTSAGEPVTEKYTVEAYETELPAGAFGLYSIHVNKFLKRDQYGFDCLTNYQLQGCFANTYLSIVFENPTEQAREGAVQLYKKYQEQAAGEKYELPMPVRDRLLATQEDGVSGRIKFIQGPIALNNSAQDLYPLLEGVENFELWMIDHTDEQGRFLYRALVFFRTAEAAQKFREQHNGREIAGFLPVQVNDPEGSVVEVILTEAV